MKQLITLHTQGSLKAAHIPRVAHRLIREEVSQREIYLVYFLKKNSFCSVVGYSMKVSLSSISPKSSLPQKTYVFVIPKRAKLSNSFPLKINKYKKEASILASFRNKMQDTRPSEWVFNPVKSRCLYFPVHLLPATDKTIKCVLTYYF